jgi:2-C-methyl-D-erythritol 2,4-cyclodiphosphate synthase
VTARTGLGIDTHRFADGRRLVLGGVEIPHERGLAGHSDADVLAHAITDAILGAVSLGDIGAHFPDTDPAWQDADSVALLREVVAMVGREGWRVAHVDATVMLERPKLAPLREAITARLAEATGGTVSVKATTGEGMGFVGREEGVAALAVATLERWSRATAPLCEASTLHVTNGDSTVKEIAATGLPGSILAWRDVLHEGPVPDVEDDERRRIRAAFVGGTPASFAERDRILDGHPGEFVLWFEADLYDQLQLAEVLARLARRGVAPERITLVSVGEHAGIAHFGGLGELDGPQLARLAEQAAAPLTAAALELGTRAWAALTAPDPRGVAALARVQSGELRFLGEAFDRLAREYPSDRDGLSLTERRLLAGAPGTRAELFLRAARKEPRPFLGDSWAFAILDRLAPLITQDGVLTAEGERVLAGRADFVARHGIDRWVGGVHLQGREVPWRFSEALEALIGPDGRPV